MTATTTVRRSPILQTLRPGDTVTVRLHDNGTISGTVTAIANDTDGHTATVTVGTAVIDAADVAGVMLQLA
jgi:hypothetical protein